MRRPWPWAVAKEQPWQDGDTSERLAFLRLYFPGVVRGGHIVHSSWLDVASAKTRARVVANLQRLGFVRVLGNMFSRENEWDYGIATYHDASGNTVRWETFLAADDAQHRYALTVSPKGSWRPTLLAHLTGALTTVIGHRPLAGLRRARQAA